jgi:4-amino-4-deoxy-L-arabinose transferase-like glycosyltransferase
MKINRKKRHMTNHLENSGIDPHNRVYWLDLLLVAVFCVAFFGFRLGSYVPLSEHEGFVAVTAQETLEGNWIVPHFNTQIRLQKTPLMYWTVAGVSSIFGGVNEWTVRLPSALGASGVALLLTFLATRMFGRLTGLVTGLTTVSSIDMLWLSHVGIADMLMTFFITACFVFFYLALERIQEEKSPRLYLMFAYIAFALGMMAKGPVPLPVVLLPIFCFLVWLSLAGRWEKIDRSSTGRKITSAIGFTFKGLWFYLKRLYLGMGLIIFIIIVGLWIAGILINVPNAYYRWYEEYVARCLGEFGTSRSFFYYIPQIFLLILPWSIFLPIGLSLPFLKIFKNHRFELMFIFFWLVIGFLFFSSVSGKRAHYILPIFPPAIMLSSAGMVFAIEHYLNRKTILQIYAVVIAITIVGLGLGCYYVNNHFSQVIEQFRVIAAVLIFAEFLSLFVYLRLNLLASTTVIAMAIGICFAIIWPIVPQVTDPNQDPRAAAKLIREAIGTESPVYFIGRAYPPLIFYTGRNMPQIPSDQEVVKVFKPGVKKDIAIAELELSIVDHVMDMLSKPQRVYLVTSDERFNVARGYAKLRKVKIYEILRIKKFFSDEKGLVVFSNYPATSTKPVTSQMSPASLPAQAKTSQPANP